MLRGLGWLLGHWALAVGLLFAASIVGVAATGPTVAAAERMVVIVGVVHLAIAIAVLVRFAVRAREFSSGAGRVVWTVVCAVGLAVWTMTMFGLTVMGLDR